MESTKATARRAGLFYLLGSVIAPIGLLYVPGKLIVAKDATATADHIRASGQLLRIGIGTELFHQVVFVYVVLVLYRLFKPVSENDARAMLVLSILGTPIVMLNVLGEIAALILVSGADYLSAFDKRQLDALAYLFIRLHSQGIFVASIFWGLWLIPFARLVIRSGFIPPFLGWLMIAAGVGYLISSTASLVFPHYAPMVSTFTTILYLGELPIILWLAIWGARERPAPALAG